MKNKLKAFKIPVIQLHYTMLTYHFNLENILKHIILMWNTFTFNILLKNIHIYYKWVILRGEISSIG